MGQSGAGTLVDPDLLNSWTEIANYLRRGTRTVQRWEVTSGLPVYRPRGKPRSGVSARKSELDLWMRSKHISRAEAKESLLLDFSQNTKNLRSRSTETRMLTVKLRNRIFETQLLLRRSLALRAGRRD